MRIGLFFDRPYVDAHFCFVEMAKHLVASGFLVDLYYMENPYNPPPVFFDDRIRLFNFPISKKDKLEFSIQMMARKFSYTAVIGTPINGAHLAYRISKKFKIPFYYLADEVFDEAVNKHGLQNFSSLKKLDVKANSSCTRTLALSKDRFEYQKKVNGLTDEHKVTILPNSPGGNAGKQRSSYFRDILNIRDNKPIVLFLGTSKWSLAGKVEKYFEGIDEWPFHIVFHGRTVGLMKGNEKNGTIKWSGIPLPMYLVNYAVSSADIGLVLYDKDVPAETKNSFTGGKIGTYLKNALPLVIGNDPNLKVLEDKGCGIFFSSIEEIDEAILKALKDKERLEKNVKRYFDEELSYDSYFEVFKKQLIHDVQKD